MKTTMKKSVARVLTLAMVLVMMMGFAIPAMATSTHNQAVVDAQQAVVQIDIWYVDPEVAEERWLGGGTGFFINEDTLLTCQHVVTGFTDEWYAWRAVETSLDLGRERTAKEIKDNIELRVAVLRDVSVKATIKKASEEMDFAILTLDEKIYDRTTLPLAKSSELKQTESVYALGFPSIVSGADDQNYNDASDVTSSTGNVNKITRSTFEVPELVNPGTDDEHYETRHYVNVDVVEHGARISAGFSGGPLVDANGNVVGVNAIGNDVGSINMAISTDPILQTLNALGIEYTTAEAAPAATEPAPTEAPTQATEAPTQATEAPTQATEAPTQATEPQPEPKPEPKPFPVVLVVAAVAVVAVIVVVVVVLSKGKKKAAPAPAAPAAGFAPAPHTPAAGGYTAPMGAGETTVLGGSAGETTVLGRSANGGTLIRKRTGETIAINAENFVIGRERKTSNYCVADNSSISRSHVTLSVRNGVTYLADMGAANGTFVNGVKAMPRQEIALKSGDKITLADEEFEFRG